MLCVTVFFDVERNFTLIAADMESEVTATVDGFNNAHGKLHDLRSQMNAATVNTNDATTLNAVNKQNLIKLQEDINSKGYCVTLIICAFNLR